MVDDAEKVQEENASINTTIETQVQKEAEETLVKQVESTMIETITPGNEETYKVKDLINNCKALGYKKEVVVGALFNCEKTEMTKLEFKNTIKFFLGKKVK